MPEPTRPALIVVSGPVASGKTTLSRAIADVLGAQRLEADRIRDTILSSVDEESAGAEARWRRDLSSDFEDEIYADLLRRAADILAAGMTLVIEACFPLRSQRDAVRALALRQGASFVFVQCVVSEETIRARLAERGPGWTAIYERLARHVEVADELQETEVVRVRTDRPIETSVAAISARVRAASLTRVAEATGSLARQPRVVSFDCWSTLLAEDDWPWAHALRVLAIRDAARQAGREVSEADAERAFNAAWQRHMKLWEERKASGAREVALWALEELAVGDADASVGQLILRLEEASHTSKVVALEGARALLAAIVAHGLPCVLVCDTGLTPGRVVRRLLARTGLLQYLSGLAFSDEVGEPKPAAGPFLAAIDGMGVDPKDVLHVGDLRRTDVAGARSLGMQTVRIRARHDDETQWPDADYTVDSHAELRRLLFAPVAPQSGRDSRTVENVSASPGEESK